MKWKVYTGMNYKLYDAYAVSVVEGNLSLKYTYYKRSLSMYSAALIETGKRADALSKVDMGDHFPSPVRGRNSFKRLYEKGRKKLRGEVGKVVLHGRGMTCDGHIQKANGKK